MNYSNRGIYLFIERMLVFLPFFGLGMVYKEILENKMDKIPNLIYFTIIFVSMFLIIACTKKIDGYSYVWCNDFDNVIIPYIRGFLGIAFWLRIAKILVPSLKDSKIVNWIGENTYSIMMHQLLGFFLLNSFIALLATIIDFKIKFNFENFRTNIYYQYLPWNIPHFYMAYLVSAIVVSYLVSKIEIWVREKLKN